MKNKLYKISNGVFSELNENESSIHENIVQKCSLLVFEEAKNNKIKELKEKTNKIFYNTYPLHRQCNIAIFGTDEEREEFKAFHAVESKKYDEILKNINSCETVEEVFSFNI